MKVFSCKTQGGYSGGLIIVAANTKEEAYLTAARDECYGWYFYWSDGRGGHDDDGNIGHCHSDHYPFEWWRECILLTANVEKPQVIIEDSYCE